MSDKARSMALNAALNGDHKRGDREGRRVVSSARNRGVRVPEPGYFVSLAARA
jgi:hypothetical protein